MSRKFSEFDENPSENVPNVLWRAYRFSLEIDVVYVVLYFSKHVYGRSAASNPRRPLDVFTRLNASKKYHSKDQICYYRLRGANK